MIFPMSKNEPNEDHKSPEKSQVPKPLALDDGDLSDEDIPDRLSQSLRSIRGSAKRKRMEKMLSTDLSQSFDGRRLFSEPTSPAVGLGSRTNTDQVFKDINLDDEYNMVFGDKSKTMPGMSASFYPGFEYEKPPSKPASTSPSRRPSTLPLPKSSKHTPPAKTSRDRTIGTSNGYSTLGHSSIPTENGMNTSSITSPGHLTPSKSTLTPLNPQKQLQHAMEILPNFKAHWESLIEEINVVKNLAMFNREVILPRAVEVTNMVIAHCNNIRSKISGAAIEALKELYRFLKKALIYL